MLILIHGRFLSDSICLLVRCPIGGGISQSALSGKRAASIWSLISHIIAESSGFSKDVPDAASFGTSGRYLRILVRYCSESMSCITGVAGTVDDMGGFNIFPLCGCSLSHRSGAGCDIVLFPTTESTIPLFGRALAT